MLITAPSPTASIAACGSTTRACSGPLDAKRDGDALVSKWGTPDTEEGETTYRLREDGTMDVIDRVKGKDGGWRDFGRHVSRDGG